MAIVLADLLNDAVALEGGALRPAETDPAFVDLVMGMVALSAQPGVLEALHGVYDDRVLALPPQRMTALRRYVSVQRLSRLVPGLPAAPAAPGLRARLARRAARVPALRSTWRTARRVRAALATPRR
jgi:hypothetical protein